MVAKERQPRESFEAIWLDDKLGRQVEAEFLIKFLLSRVEERGQAGQKRSYVVNIDAGWGRGKSFFLGKLGQTLRARGYLVASVNAWRDDHAEDPLLAVMAAIDAAVRPFTRKSTKAKRAWEAIRTNGVAIGVKAIRSAGLTFIKNKIGVVFDDLVVGPAPNEGKVEGRTDVESVLTAGADAVEGEIEAITDRLAQAAIDEFNRNRTSMDDFRRRLEAFLSTANREGARSPLFVLVDELDRCRPPYAIALLERVKHLFDVNDVIFVVATDGEQLAHAVGAVYGERFDSSGYLRRFFDRKYTFQAPTTDEFVRSLLIAAPLQGSKLRCPENLSLEEYCVATFDFFGLSLRDTQQCMDLLRSVTTAWSFPFPIQISIMLPVIVGTHMGVALGNSVRRWSEQLLEFANTYRGRVGRSVLTITVWDGSSGKPTKVDPLFWLQLLSNIGNEQLIRICEGDYRDGGDFRKAFTLELEGLYGSEMAARGKHSVVATYVEMARTAGRLAEYLLPDPDG